MNDVNDCYLMIIIGDRHLEHEIRQILHLPGAPAARTARHPNTAAANEGAHADIPDIIIMNSAALTRYNNRRTTELRTLKKRCRLLVIVKEASAEKVMEAVQFADGIAFYRDNLHHLLAIVRLMQADHIVIPTAIARAIIIRNLRREILQSLTPPEQRLLRLIGHGCSNAAIATATHIEPSRVKYLIRSLLKKLLLQNRTQAAVLAAREAPYISKVSEPAGKPNGASPG